MTAAIEKELGKYKRFAVYDPDSVEKSGHGDVSGARCRSFCLRRLSSRAVA